MGLSALPWGDLGDTVLGLGGSCQGFLRGALTLVDMGGRSKVGLECGFERLDMGVEG